MSEWPQPAAAASLETELISTAVLGSAAAAITISGFNTDYKFFETLGYLIMDGSASNVQFTINNYSTANSNVIDGSSTGLTINRAAGQPGFTQVVNVDASSVFSFHMTLAKPVPGQRATFNGLACLVGGGASIRLELNGGSIDNGSNSISSFSVTKATGNFATNSRLTMGGAKIA